MKLRIKRYNRKVPKHRKIYKPERIWYWGIHEDFGQVFCTVRTDDTPHLCINFYSTNRKPGYCGYDHERNRWIVRPYKDTGMRNIGWRRKEFGRW